MRQEVARAGLERREPPPPAPELDDDGAAVEPLVDVAAVPHEQLEAPPAHVQRTELEPPPNGAGDPHLDRDADPYLHTDAGAARTPSGEQDERRPISRREVATAARSHADGAVRARGDDDATPSDDEKPGPGRRRDEPRRAAQIEREPDRPHENRDGAASVIRDVHRPRRPDGDRGPRGPDDETATARGAGRSRRHRRQKNCEPDEHAHAQRGTTVYVSVAVYCPAGTLGSGVVNPIFVGHTSPLAAAAVEVDPIARSGAGAIGSAARTVGEMPEASTPPEGAEAASPSGRSRGEKAVRCAVSV